MDMEQRDVERMMVEQARFSLFAPPISSVMPYKKDATLEDVCTWMNSVKLIKLTNELRKIKDEDEQRKFKATRLPYATFSGQFSSRKADGLIEPSGLMCFDFDHLGSIDEVRRVKKLLVSDTYFATMLMFTSPRGEGVKWVTHVDLSRGDYKRWYAAITHYLLSTYGLVADSAPSNIASACFLCFDAEMVTLNSILEF